MYDVWCMSLCWQSWRTSQEKKSSIFLLQAESVKITHNIPTNRKNQDKYQKKAQATAAREKKRRENYNGKKNERESARETMTLNPLILEYYIHSVYFAVIWTQTNFFFFANGITIKWGEQILLPAEAVWNSWYSSFALCRQNEHRKSFRICVCIHFFAAAAAAATSAVVHWMYRKSGKKAPSTRECTNNGIPYGCAKLPLQTEFQSIQTETTFG